MGYDEQDQNHNNQLTKTSGNAGITQRSADTRRESGRQVHVDT